MSENDYELHLCDREKNMTLHKIYYGAGTKTHRCVGCTMKAAQRNKLYARDELSEIYGTKLTRNL